MQISTLLSIILPVAMVSQVAAQKSYCKSGGTSNPDCQPFNEVCTNACPRECGAGFKLQSLNKVDGKCGCFCTK
ncbi:hypothetical protein CKAH01_16691 [Colletotrichum kahawae]|uniref:Uncharacterized protein n=1 Tax=Colletotrichum kahawae TaxID=34407 RepID=A0AAD9YEI6_COLKA|nr:hypothetical protein CKAH01_16691 [Colletotrichum kahawae]